MDCGFDFVGLLLVVRFLWFVDSVWLLLVGGSALLPAYGLACGGCCADWHEFCGCYAYWFGVVLISCLGEFSRCWLLVVDWLLVNSVDYFVFCCFYWNSWFVFDVCCVLV